jgi:hypothetical protein
LQAYGVGNFFGGAQAGNFTVTGSHNLGLGSIALHSVTSGANNVAEGDSALFSNTTGNNNTANGAYSLYWNTTGSANTANGAVALFSNTTGNDNVANGYYAIFGNTTGSGNVAGATVSGGVPVYVNPSGQLGTLTSSARFKKNIQDMGVASESLLGLRPVTFQYKAEIDPQGTPQFGLVAEEVEKVDPALVAYDDKGRPYSVRYEAVNAMLLNEFLKQHQQVTEQAAEIEDLKARLERLEARMERRTGSDRTGN